MAATANNAPLVLKNFSGVPEITPDAYSLKKAALDAARPVARVDTPEQQLVAVEALKGLKSVRSGMEASRKAVKAPVLDLGRKIDDIAHKFIAEIDKQYMRISGLINHYQRVQARIKAEEQQKIEGEQATAKDLRDQASILRQEALVTDEPQAVRDLNDRADQLEAKAFDLEMNVEVAVVPGVYKPKGLVVRNKINYQVVSPILFVQAYPQFWKWHEDTETLKLDRLSVLDELNKEDGLFRQTRFPEELAKGEDRRLVQPAGLRVYEETKAHLR